MDISRLFQENHWSDKILEAEQHSLHLFFPPIFSSLYLIAKMCLQTIKKPQLKSFYLKLILTFVLQFVYFQEKMDLGELMVSLCYLPKAGRLTVTIIKGRNLKAMDITGASGKYRVIQWSSCRERFTTNILENIEDYNRQFLIILDAYLSNILYSTKIFIFLHYV